MSGSGLVGFGLILVGSVVASPLVVVLGVAAVLFDLVRIAWTGRALRNVRYSRTLGRSVLVVGDEAPLTVEIWNAKRLPLPWLTADDRATTAHPVADFSQEDLLAHLDAQAIRQGLQLVQQRLIPPRHAAYVAGYPRFCKMPRELARLPPAGYSRP